MTFTNVRYADASNTAILAEVEGVASCIPVDPRNRHYAELVATKAEIAPAAE